jgi:hypothetical protein
MRRKVKELCVRHAPAIYACATAGPGTTLDMAERMLRPYVEKGLCSCAIIGKDAVYFSPDGTRTIAPRPAVEFRIALRL